MDTYRFAMIGAGFWAGYQLAAWQEITGAKCVAIVDPTRDKAERLAARFGIASVYAETEAMLREQTPDFLDIVAPVEFHAPLVRLAAQHRLPRHLPETARRDAGRSGKRSLRFAIQPERRFSRMRTGAGKRRFEPSRTR